MTRKIRPVDEQVEALRAGSAAAIDHAMTKIDELGPIAALEFAKRANEVALQIVRFEADIKAAKALNAQTAGKRELTLVINNVDLAKINMGSNGGD